MKIFFHKNFERQFKKLKVNERKKFKERIKLFINDPFNLVLGNHPLHGKYKGYRSINIGGSLRSIYKMINNDAIIFVAVDTHSNLYS